jgi:hypothetical protein
VKISLSYISVIVLLTFGCCCKEKPLLDLTAEDNIILSEAPDTIRYINQSNDTAVFVLLADSFYSDFPNRKCGPAYKWRTRQYFSGNNFIRVNVKRGMAVYAINNNDLVLAYNDIALMHPYAVNIKEAESSAVYQVVNNITINGKLYPYGLSYNGVMGSISELIIVPEFGIVSFQYVTGERWTLLP